jgi:diacylglycerol kinase family enzyme
MTGHARGHAATIPAEATGDGLGRAWLVTNPASGSADAAGPADLLKAIEAAGGLAAEESSFPDESLPDTATLRDARIDTLVVYAGDGTVNAILARLRDWPGRLLVLPGGTMNLLARAHHGEAGWEEILAAAPGAPARPLPVVEAEDHLAAVALVAGPWAHWAHAREGVREGRLSRMWRATRLALARSFARGLRVSLADGTRLPGRHRMAVMEPQPDSGLAFHGVPARSARELAQLGAAFLADDWRKAAGVASWTGSAVAIEGRGAIAALVDGEPVKLAAPAKVTAGTTTLAAIRTKEVGGAE